MTSPIDLSSYDVTKGPVKCVVINISVILWRHQNLYHLVTSPKSLPSCDVTNSSFILWRHQWLYHPTTLGVHRLGHDWFVFLFSVNECFRIYHIMENVRKLWTTHTVEVCPSAILKCIFFIYLQYCLNCDIFKFIFFVILKSFEMCHLVHELWKQYSMTSWNVFVCM